MEFEKCPRCGSAEVQTVGKLGTFLILIGVGSCSLWVGLIFFPFLIIAGLAFLLTPLSFFVPKMTSCKKCNYNWKQGEAESYKKALDDKTSVLK